MGVVAIACLVTLPLVGISAWTDYATLLRSVSEPVRTPHNFTLGAVLYQAGLGAELATAIQWSGVVVVLVLLVVGARRLVLAAGFVVAVTATQLVSPLLWDHYAVILLLPTAWLLANGARWAFAIPLATSLPLLWIVPAAIYPIVFWAALVGPFLLPSAWRGRASGGSVPAGVAVTPLAPSSTAESLVGMLDDSGAKLFFLPKYSPDLNPIENAFAKLKAGLRRAAERSTEALWQRIGQLIEDFTPKECTNYFKAAGYDPA